MLFLLCFTGNYDITLKQLLSTQLRKLDFSDNFKINIIKTKKLFLCVNI